MTTPWDGLTAADFDVTLAPKSVRKNTTSGQDQLFATGTPTVAPKPAPVREELPGQDDLFGGEDQDVAQ